MPSISNQNSEEMDRDLRFYDEPIVPPGLPSNMKARSEDESKKFWEDYYNKRVTPELLKDFSHEEALGLVKYFFRTPGAETQTIGGNYSLGNLDKNSKSFLEKELRNANIIEIGNKGLIQNAEFAPFGIRSYQGTDCDYGNDALTHLMKQPDESAVICSFGVLESGVLDSWVGRDKPLGRYIDLLAKEIYRVTPKGAITLHGTDGFTELEKAGFADERILLKGHMGNVVSYRRIE
ncbi:MAG: hypothetical protein U9Q06_04500 [Nanoarchaeota archaeon]|nr:hypothetical protein [Nanoarchaeota archaeon]